MERKISDLDFSNEMDIIYAYKKISESPSEILKKLSVLKINDYNFGLFILGIIEKACLIELEDHFHDKEMDEMLEISIISNKNVDECIISTPESNGEIKKDSEDQNNEKIDSKFHIKNLNLLLNPIIGVCNKQIVNLVYYVFRTSGISHFDFLFNEFTENAQRVELHLLIAKAIRGRSFDLSDVKEALENAINEENSQEICVSNLPLENSFENKDTDLPMESIFDNKEGDLSIIPLPFLESELDSSNAMNLKPFKFNLNADHHLDCAKKILLGNSSFPWRFYMENLYNFLTLKFDREILLKFRQFDCYDEFKTYSAKLPSMPYFIFDSISFIDDILRYFPKLTFPNPYLIEDSHSDPINSNPLNSSKILFNPNCHLLKSYLEVFEKFLPNKFKIPLDWRIGFVRGLKVFLEHYNSVAFFDIFNELLIKRYGQLTKDEKYSFLDDIDFYMEAFYNQNPIKKASKIKGWYLSKENDDFTEVCYTREEFLNAYHNPSFYQEESDSIANHLLYLFYKKRKVYLNDRRGIFEKFLLEVSQDPVSKIFILRKIGKIIDLIKKNSDREFKIDECSDYSELSNEEDSSDVGDKVNKEPENIIEHSDIKDSKEMIESLINNLAIFPEMNWRYKKVFIPKLKIFEENGFSTELIKQQLSKDKVFYIRKMIEDLNEK